MQKKIYKTILISLLFVPLVASAASFPYWGEKGLVSCTGTGCKSLCDLLATGQNIIYFMMTLAVFVIGPVMIVAGGIMMLISAGSETLVSSGRKMATGAVIGIAIALGAFIIVNTFFYVIAPERADGKPKSWSNIQCSFPGTNP